MALDANDVAGEALETELLQQVHVANEMLASEMKLRYSLDKQQVVIVKRNDKIKDKIDEVLSSLETKRPILVVGWPGGINKMVSIVEILKQKSSIRQYNKMSRLTTTINPYTKEELSEIDKIKQELNPKQYQVPIMMSYLVPLEFTLDLDWTHQ